MSRTRTLILMRHAKSDYPGGTADHDRPLAERGRHEAALAGEWLRAELPPVEEVLSSDAVRTVQTVAATAIDAPVRFAPEIYEATPDEILEQIRATADSVGTLLVVGHAPGIPGLVLDLAGPGSDDTQLTEVERRFPTAASAVVEFAATWAELDLGAGRLQAFHIPRF